MTAVPVRARLVRDRPQRLALTGALVTVVLAVAVTAAAGVRAQTTPLLTAAFVCEGDVSATAQLRTVDNATGKTARLGLSCSPERPRSSEVQLRLPRGDLAWSADVMVSAPEERSCHAEGTNLPIRLRCDVARGGAVLRVPGRDAPGPEECQVAPLPAESITAMVATPVAQSLLRDTLLVMAAAGAPSADDAVTSAVATALREIIACANAGDYLRLFALVSDSYIGSYLAAAGPLEGDALQFLAAAPIPLPFDRHTAIVAIEDVRLLPDGRAAATVHLDRPTDQPTDQRALAIFVRVDDRWLLDAETPLELAPSPTPTP